MQTKGLHMSPFRSTKSVRAFLIAVVRAGDCVFHLAIDPIPQAPSGVLSSDGFCLGFLRRRLAPSDPPHEAAKCLTRTGRAKGRHSGVSGALIALRFGKALTLQTNRLGSAMLSSLSRRWGLLVLRGVLAILFGVLVAFWPGLAWIVVIASFAAYTFLDGVFAIASATVGHPSRSQWWALILEGVLGISAAVLAIAWPGITQLALLWIIAYWAIVTGVFQIAAAIRLRKEIKGEWLLGLAGVLSVAFGISLVVMPAAGALAIALWIAAYNIVFGILLVALGLRLRPVNVGQPLGSTMHRAL
jgi:uncharacterized membrane protein HdeD (DUF308 family)